MKILYISNTANFSKFNKPFMKWCLEQGWQVDYCAPDDERITDCSNHIVLPIPRSPYSKGVLRCIKELRNIIEKNNYDIIHCHTPMGGLIARIAAKNLFKRNKLKIIYTAHGFHFYKGAPLLNWLLYYPVEKFLTRYTSALITINKEDYNLATKKFSKKTNIYFMNGVGVNLARFSQISDDDVLQIREKLGFSRKDFIITVVAELNKNKNQTLLIRQVKYLKEKIPTLKILFLGKETLPIAHNLVNELKINDVCEFLGYRNDVDLFEKMSDICFSASLREGLPVNIIEGMACGKVCVCSKNRGHCSLIENEKNGLLFDYNKPDDMSNQILRVYNNKEFGRKLASQASIDAKQYGIDYALEFTIGLYQKIIR